MSTSTISTYVGNGVQTDFTFAFDYLRKSFVKVTVDDTIPTFVFTSAYTIQIAPAPAVGEVVIIRRDTDRDRLVAFVDGSVLLANDLNVSALQAIHIAAEAQDVASGSLLIDDTGAYSAGFRRIANIGTPTQDADAATKEYADTGMTSQLALATAEKTQAVAAKTDAEAARDTAVAQGTVATTKAAEALASKDASGASATSAATSASTATTKAAEAAASSGTATTKAAEAVAARDVAVTKASEAAASASSVDVNRLVPSGAVMHFAMVTPPAGWLEMDGTAKSRTAYADLFAAIGTIFGAGDGSTTFNLPMGQGEFIRGWDHGRGVDAGRAFGSAQGDAMKNHTHTGTTSPNGNHTHSPVAGGNFLGTVGPIGGFGGGGLYINNGAGAMTQSGDHTHTVTTGNPSTGGGTETRGRNIALLACIKT